MHVISQFGEAWELSGSEDRGTIMNLGMVAAGSVAEASLVLTPVESGKQQLQFEVTSDTHPPEVTTAQADIHDRLVQFSLAGPERRFIGQRAEYVLSLVNISGRELSEARVDVSFDASLLAVREASTGGIYGRDSLTWELGTLLKDERVLIQIEFECLAEALGTPVAGRFCSQSDCIAQTPALLAIVPPAPIEVTIVDPDDPFTMGAQARFIITVRNRSRQVVDDLELRVTTSPHFEGLAIAPESQSAAIPPATDAYGVNLRTVRLPPQAELRYVATAQAVLPGEGALRVLLRTKALLAPFEHAEAAVVTPADPSERP